MVLREEIRLRLWPNNTIVEFDHGINAAVQKLRDALGDSASEPRYVETVARRGYRFLGAVEKLGEPEPADPPPEIDQSHLEGTTVSHYRILEKLGEGGMGVVWRAHDPRLNRDVAIKISPERFSDRFEREARVIAALNHPKICTLYDVGPNFLVMELIEGESPKGPLPLEEALRIAHQIADALDAAHEKGIVHRDLKPGNIKIKPDGAVKVLDFGLAKTIELASGDPEDSPTVTVAGMIIGTAAYMSPEQARGKIVDRRADIWAFGVVLYELLTGRRPFHGNALQEMVASVVKDHPDLSEIPAQVRPLVERCLEKDPRKRLRDIGDAWGLLEEPAIAAPPKQTGKWLLWAFAGVLAVVGALGWLRTGSYGNERLEMTLSIVPPAGVTLNPTSSPVISPDGSAVMYNGTPTYVCLLTSSECRLVPGPGTGITGPGFWSPDSTTVVFPNPTGSLMKVRMPDGAAETIGALHFGPRGGSWSDAGTILIADGVLFAGPASGGDFKHVDVPESSPLGVRSKYYPEFLPGGEDFLFLFAPAQDPDEAGVFLATLRDGRAVDPVLLFKNQTAARYTPAGGGRLLFVRGDNLYSQHLNRRARKLEGEPELVALGVASVSKDQHLGYFSVAGNGTVVWRPGKAAASQVTEFDRQGNPIRTSGPLESYDSLVLSPDEKRLLVSAFPAGWLVDVGQPGRLDLPKGVIWFGWSAGGSKLIGVRGPPPGLEFVEISATGSGEVQGLRKMGLAYFRGLPRISGDGKQVVVNVDHQLISTQIEGASDEIKPRVVVRSGGQPFGLSFSPDGRWFTYEEKGPGGGLYVQPLPGLGPRRQISATGGRAVWRRDGKEIVFWDGKSVMSVPVEWWR